MNAFGRALGGAVVGVTLGLAALTGCSQGTSNATQQPSAPVTTNNGSTQDSDPTETASKLPDPVLKTYVPVRRNGRVPHPSILAAPAKFHGTVRYPDGLRLAVLSVEQGTVTGQGVGVINGEPKTAIRLRMTNNTKHAVDLNRVVVTMIYGTARRQAQPVYDATARDFNGTVKPGASTTARYVFSVPKSQLGDVTMIVDFDARHEVARFHGAAG